MVKSVFLSESEVNLQNILSLLSNDSSSEMQIVELDDGRKIIMDSSSEKSFSTIEVDDDNYAIRFKHFIEMKNPKDEMKTRELDLLKTINKSNLGIVFAKCCVLDDRLITQYDLPYQGGVTQHQILNSYMSYISQDALTK